MKTKLLLSALALLFLLACVPAQIKRSAPMVCFREHCFEVEIADDPYERAKGLMFRESLGDGKGMLFMFDEENIYPFWMKNTNIPLDIIWIYGNGSIGFIEKNAQPCRDECKNIVPQAKAKYVLEINAGLAEQFDLAIGEILASEIFS